MPKWKIYAVGLPLLCAVIAVSWFAYFVSTGQVEHAEKGGAIGVMMSFASLFLLSTDRYHSIEVLDSSSQAFFDSVSRISSSDSRVLSEENSTRIWCRFCVR